MRNLVPALFTIGLIAVAGANPAEAGCGCDHPPPIRGTVYPRFASGGQPISIHSPAITSPDVCVRIGGVTSKSNLPTSEPETVVVTVPGAADKGPQAVEIFDVPCAQVGTRTRPVAEIPASAFTKLPRPIAVVEREGTFFYDDIRGAIDSEGTLLVPFDITHVVRPMQFYITVLDLPLRFDTDGLNYYNQDEYNLKLFEHLVTGPDDFQWGPFYGANVSGAGDPRHNSDTIEYWRHEFESYALAHLPGGTHAAGADGLHPDGTMHVDHYNLVVAISGYRSASQKNKDPYDASAGSPLQPGAVEISVAIGQLLTDGPVARADLNAAQQAILDGTVAEVVPRSGKIKENSTVNGGSYR